MLQSFRLACAAYRLNNADARMMLAEFVRSSKAELHAQPDPIAKAPELWADRIGRKENPVTFIRRVYRDHLNGSMTRAMLRQLDPELYNALAVWENRHPHDVVTELPKRRHRRCASAAEIK
ncbi:MAG: hypothetical protein ACK4TP_14750 [Hyphomicrobium sp.]